MIWYAWVLVGTIALSSLMVIASIGKPRKPQTPGGAVAVLIVNGLIVWAVVSLALRA